MVARGMVDRTVKVKTCGAFLTVTVLRKDYEN